MATERFLNNTRNGSQDSPAIAALPNGGFVAVWDDGELDYGKNGFDGFTGVYGRVFDANGVAVTNEFRVANDTYNQQFSGRVVALPDGSWVVGWDSNGYDRNGIDNDINVYVRRFALVNGAVVALGNQVQITPDRPAGDPRGFFDQYLNDLVPTPDGGFRIAYTASNVRTDWDVYTQRFNAQAQLVTGESRIETDVDTGLARAGQTRTPGYQLLPLADGGFFAAYWEESSTYPVGDQIWLQRNTAAGTPVGPRILVTAPGDVNDNTYPLISALDGGGFAVAWRSRNDSDIRDSDTFVRTFDANGTPLSAPVRVNTELSRNQIPGSIVPLPGGDFIVGYTSYDRSDFPTDYFDGRARLFNALSQPVTGSFDVSSYVYEDMGNVVGTRLASGRVAYAWSGGASVKEDVFGIVLGQTDFPTVTITGTIIGGVGPETLTGTAFNDIFRPGPAATVLQGGLGLDTVQLADARTGYGVMRRGGEILIARTDRSVLDRAVDVEQITFAGGSAVSTASLPSITPWEYLAGNLDLQAAFRDNLAASEAHRLSFGVAEGRSGFDGLSYLASHRDLHAVYGTDEDAAAQHYLQYGRAEGRAVTFDPLAYVASYADLGAGIGINPENASLHYLRYGEAEGRIVSFSPLAYLASYDDLAKAFGVDTQKAEMHFITIGCSEGRTVAFDALDYTASYGDLIRSFGLDAQAATLHYLQTGHAEGRTAQFDATQYLRNYADLAGAYGTDQHAATRHYIAYGFAEGRTDHALR